MTVNAISDIHASIDPFDHSVAYGLPLKRKPEEYLKSLRVLHGYFEKHLDELSKMEFQRENRPSLYLFSPPVVCRNAKEVMTTLAKALKIAERGRFTKSELTGKNIRSLFFKMTSIAKFVSDNHIRWFSADDKLKEKDVGEIANYVIKLGTDFDPSKLEKADVLVIAGDLGTDNIYEDVLRDIEEKTSGKFKKILHIAGNHDLWWFGDEKLNFRKEKRPDSFNLEHAYCEWTCGDVVFLGCTLWTPIPPCNAYTVARTMNDYNYAPRFTVHDSSTQYALQSAWLRKKLEEHKDRKVVVFTHHQPFAEMVDDDYRHSDVNSAYVVTDGSLDDIGKTGNIRLWICGHSHGHRELEKNGVRVVRNPIGYRDHYGYRFPEVDPEFWYGNVYEV